MIRLAIFAKHPVYYQVPIFREVHARSEQSRVRQTVLFGDDLSLREFQFSEISNSFKPNVPDLLIGYAHRFLTNVSRDAKDGFLSRINPGIFQELAPHRYDVVLIHGYETLSAWMILLWARLRGIQVAWRGEAIPRREKRTGWRSRLRAASIRFFLSRCHAVFYSCSANRDFLAAHGVGRSRLHALACAVDNRFYQAEAQRWSPLREQTRRELGLSLSDTVVLFSARFTSRKRPLDLIRAVAGLPVRSGLALLFVGDGPERQRMAEACQLAGIPACFTGFVQPLDIGRYAAAADIFSVISDYDPSPKALNEAMNFSLPVVVSHDVGTAQDLVIEGVNGYTIQTGDLRSLGAHLLRLHRDPTLRKVMGEASLRIVSEFNFAANAKAIESVAFELTSRRRDVKQKAHT